LINRISLNLGEKYKKDKMKQFLGVAILICSLFLLVPRVMAQSEEEHCDGPNQKGETLYQQAKYSEALTEFLHANECYRKTGDQTGGGTTLNNIGDVYYRWGQTAQALTYYQQSLTIAQGVGNQTGEGEALNNIGDVYYRRGEYEQAVEYYLQSLTVRREVGDRGGEGADLNDIGDIYFSWDQYDQAFDYYRQSLAIAQEINDRAREAESLKDIGRVYNERDQYYQGLDYYQQSLTIRRKIGDRDGEGTTLNNIGSVYYHLGQYNQALDTYQASLTIHQEIGNRPGAGDNLSNIGRIYYQQGHYNEALKYFQQSLAIHQETGNRSGQGNSLSKIGLVHDRLGQFEQALGYFRQSQVIYRDIGNRAGQSTNLSHIASVYLRQGQYEQALDHYQQSLIFDQAIGDPAGVANNLNNIGITYDALGQARLALDYFRQSQVIYQEVGNRNGEVETLINIGLVSSELGEYEQALNDLQQSLVSVQEMGKRDHEARILHNLGLTFTRWGKYDQALGYYKRSLLIQREIGNRVSEAYSLQNIGYIYSHLGQYDQALDYYQQSLIIRQEIRDKEGEGNILANIGAVYYFSKRYEQALNYYQQAMKIVETLRSVAGTEQSRASFIDRYIYIYPLTVILTHLQGQNEKAFLASEQGRARAFLDSLATGQVRLRDDEATDLLTQEQELYTHRQAIQVELIEAQIPSSPNADRIASLKLQLAEMDKAYEAVQQLIASRRSERTTLISSRNMDTVLSVEQVQSMLDPQTTLLSYYIADKVLVFVLTAKSFETFALDVDPADLTQEINVLRDFSNVTVAHPTSAVTLYEMLIEPLKDKLPTPHLAIIPHQQLHYLPFAALTDGERYLIDDYTLTVLPSASALPFIQDNAQQTAYSGQPSALIVGNPVTADYDTVASLATTRDSLGSLPFAEREAKAIAELFGVEPLIGEAATESAVQEQVPQANILHLAAHGKFNPVAPLNSLIALAPDEENDGWLTVGESYGINLEHTDLVVLSACETNLGDLSAGDELVGLTRALIFAGTPSVIASLWAVEDEATSLLMERFYIHLKGGVGKAEALRQAQIEVRAEYPNPYYWSGFVLSGDPGLEP